MQNVRANVKVMEFQSLCIFSCILTLLIILIKPLTTKAHDRRASGDCGTSGVAVFRKASGPKTLASKIGKMLAGPQKIIIHWIQYEEIIPNFTYRTISF